MTKDRAKLKAAKARYRRRLRIKKFGLAFADVDMRGRHGNQPRGPRNPRWSGGVYHTSHGYRCVSVPVNHHLRQAHGYAYEHALVAEQKLGRRLSRGEVVHHINGDKLDNRPENLDAKLSSQHSREHALARKRAQS